MGHVVLLGDSIFDNGRYVPGGPSMIEQLHRSLPNDWRATLLAVDGSIAADVASQMTRLPSDVTHLVVSAGGNNALDQSSLILHDGDSSFAEVLYRLADIRAEFQKEYRTMLQTILEVRKPVIVCTVYDSVPGLDRAEHMGLCLFNEVILREAFRFHVPVIDLRLICTDSSDYARTSPIEPSVVGGGKIARAVIRAVTGFDAMAAGSLVFA